MIYQLLNFDQVDVYKITSLRESYDELFKNYFLGQLMRHLYFIMPNKPSKELADLARGLVSGRIYAVVGMVKILVDKSVHSLCVVHNPYIHEDPRK